MMSVIDYGKTDEEIFYPGVFSVPPSKFDDDLDKMTTRENQPLVDEVPFQTMYDLLTDIDMFKHECLGSRGIAYGDGYDYGADNYGDNYGGNYGNSYNDSQTTQVNDNGQTDYYNYNYG